MPRKSVAAHADYWRLTQRPLQSLWFLLPLMIFYELALPIYGTDTIHRVSEDIYARRLMAQFFEWFGVTGYYLPGLLVLGVLLGWHLKRRDPWTFQPRLYATMLGESVLLALPLFVFLVLLAQHLQMRTLASPARALGAIAGNTGGGASGFAGAANGASGGGGVVLSWQAQIVFSIGAGIYEEMLFRLMAIALVYMVIVDVLAFSKRVGIVGAITISAVLFGLYHFPDRSQSFDTARFIQLTIAGVYLAAVYVLRGFGVVVGTHAVYDVLVVLAQAMHPR